MKIDSCEHWDGTATMPVVTTDGGRQDAGFKGRAGDCVTRAVAIASGRPYQEVYDAFASGNQNQRLTKRGSKQTGKRTASHGINTGRKWFKDLMQLWGFVWVPCMQIGSGCKVHLLRGELPAGRLVVALSKHYTCVLDGVVHDAFDPHRASIWTRDGVQGMSHRCVYGYWRYDGAN